MSNREEQAEEHNEPGIEQRPHFQQLGGEETVDPGATDSRIAGTTGTDGGQLTTEQ